MANIHIITGAPLTGKSSFIRQIYNSDEYVILDFASHAHTAYGSVDALSDEDKLMQVINDLTGLGMEGLMDNKTLVFEYCTGYGDEAFLAILQKAKSTGVTVKIKQLTCDVEIAAERNKLVRQQEDYFSSYHLREHIIDLIDGIVDSLEMTKKFNLI